MAADVTENEAEKKLSPALEELLEGNRRFTSGRTSAYRRDLAMLQAHHDSVRCCRRGSYRPNADAPVERARGAD